MYRNSGGDVALLHCGPAEKFIFLINYVCHAPVVIILSKNKLDWPIQMSLSYVD